MIDAGDFKLKLKNYKPRLRGLKEVDSAKLRPASVLIPIVNIQTDPAIILTKRTDFLSVHAGQICFPGGKREAEDHSSQATALRETEEEIGLDSSFVEMVGHLDFYHTISGFSVSPIVAFVRSGFRIKPDPTEVEEVFELPLHYILEKDRFEKGIMNYKGTEREYYLLHYKQYKIWGATAGMLKNLCDVIQ